MAPESKPLFHPEVIRQQVRSFHLPERVGDWQPKLPLHYQHFLALSIRRSAGLRLSGRHTYLNASGNVVARRIRRHSGHVEESGVIISGPVLLAFAERMRLCLGFLVDSVRNTEREIAEIGGVDERFRRYMHASGYFATTRKLPADRECK